MNTRISTRPSSARRNTSAARVARSDHREGLLRHGALRIIAAAAGDKVIFKGGTSLSKGWNLIQRFSEDIDIFFDPTSFEPPLGKKGIDRELKKLREPSGSIPP